MSRRDVLALVVALSWVQAGVAVAQTYRAVPLKLPTLAKPPAATTAPTATPAPTAAPAISAVRALPVLRPPALPTVAPTVVAPVAPPPSAGSNALSGQRSYVGGNFALVLGGVKCGFVKSVEGGGVQAEVIQEPTGPDYFRKKHLGPPTYADLSLQAGLGLGAPLYQWIAATWKGSPDRKDGAIVACDHSLTVKSERQFLQALLIETGVPACDGASKEPGYLSLRVRPQLVTSQQGATVGTKFTVDVGQEQKAWSTRNFRLLIDNIDCTRVSRIEPFSVKTVAVEEGVGERRVEKLVPGRVEFPNLRVTVAEVAADTWVAWHQQFVVLGVNDQSVERQGRLELLSPNQQTVLATIRFYNLGIFRLAPAKLGSNADQISRLVADLYCERMEFVPAP